MLKKLFDHDKKTLKQRKLIYPYYRNFINTGMKYT